MTGCSEPEVDRPPTLREMKQADPSGGRSWVEYNACLQSYDESIAQQWCAREKPFGAP